MSMPKSRYERNRIHNISDQDFWSSWKRRDPELRPVIDAGRAGDDSAWVHLAQYLRSRTTRYWETVQVLARERVRLNPEWQEKAQNVFAGRINGWHSHVIDFGKDIDFNARFGKSGQYGFHYLMWLVPLSDRYILDRDPKDLRRLLEIVRQYYAQRNSISWCVPHLDPVFYELGSWAKTRALLPVFLSLIHTVNSPAGKDVEPFLKLFMGFGRSLFRIERRGYRRGNWQLVGATGLYTLGTTFDDFREASSWRRRAQDISLAHLRKGFYRDGGHEERCWSYGWMSLNGMIEFYEQGRASGYLDSAGQTEYRRLIRRALRWYVDSLAPGDIMPAYGDGDLVEARQVLRAADRYLPGWKERNESRILRQSGYAIMRAGTPEDGMYMNINFGKWGGGHTHNDLLDFNAWAFGKPVIEEVGRFDSYDNSLAGFFRSPEAHNQIVVDHCPMNRRDACGQDVVWHSDERIDYFSAWHDAFGPRIHRHILFIKPECWITYDSIVPGETNAFAVSSYLHAVRPFKITGPGKARVTGRNGAWVQFADAKELRRFECSVDVAGEEVTVDRLFHDRFFLRTRKWPSTTYVGNRSFCMLIYPYKGKPPRVSIGSTELKGGERGVAEAFRVTSPRGTHTVVFNPFLSPGVKLGRTQVASRMFLRCADGRTCTA